jgi:hypothetical protein
LNPEEYRQVVASHDGMVRHRLFKARPYREHCKVCLGVQLPLFDEDSGELGMSYQPAFSK